MKANLTLQNIFLAVITCLIISSCGKEVICERGNKAIEKREIYLEDFNQVELHGSGHVYIRQGEVQKVEVETNSDLFHLLNTNVRNGKWEIKFTRCVKKYSGMNVYITVPNITALKISGSGKIQTDTDLSSDQMDLEITGSGKIEVGTYVNTLKSSVTGSGDIILAGSADYHEIKISGSGKVRSYNLNTRSSKVNISGSGDALIRVNEALAVTITGSGSVHYKGTPSIDSKITGSGKIISEN